MNALSNPDLAIPLYIAVVIAGIMLGTAWKPFFSTILSTTQSAQQKASGAK